MQIHLWIVFFEVLIRGMLLNNCSIVIINFRCRSVLQQPKPLNIGYPLIINKSLIFKENEKKLVREGTGIEKTTP